MIGKKPNSFNTSVLVIGSGIAGTCAALSAAEFFAKAEAANAGATAEASAARAQGANTYPTVMLASKGPLFSGSSFFEGTWGLGLIAPDGSEDEEDLARTIVRVGCGVADEALVNSFVTGISPSIERLKQWGVALKEASGTASDQREYIPCFDHKHRLWRGIERTPYVQAMGARIAERGIAVREGWELLDVDAENRVATFFIAGSGNSLGHAESGENAHSAGLGKGAGEKTAATSSGDACKSTEKSSATRGAFVCVRYEALVLCTGGASSLFSRHLTRNDCCATVQGLAQNLGCRLTNLAFMQFMPGIVSPVQGVVFNEKTFRCMSLEPAVQARLGGEAETERLLDQRSSYGPFTCRLDAREIDFAIHRAGAQGLVLTPHFGDEDDLPEFVRTYQAWLERDAGVSASTPLRVALYAHANNGGICIDQRGCTGVAGIFAAGECTGGMHGADRLGGLSSANGLVFGMRAGESAAAYALNATGAPIEPAAACELTAPAEPTAADPHEPAELPAWTKQTSPQAAKINKELSALMDASCMIVREKHQVEEARTRIEALEKQLAASSRPAANVEDAAFTRTVQLRLATARALVSDIARQQTSRGSHYWGNATSPEKQA